MYQQKSYLYRSQGGRSHTYLLLCRYNIIYDGSAPNEATDENLGAVAAKKAGGELEVDEQTPEDLGV